MSERDLNFHRFFGREKVLRAVDVRAEGGTFVADFSQAAQAENLEAARIGEDRPRPGHEAMQSAHVAYQFVARAQK